VKNHLDRDPLPPLLTSELRHGNMERARDSRRIAELSAEIDRLQQEIVERDRAID
jgi:hypothetical protein